MSRVISLEEAAKRTGLTKLEIGKKISRRELSIERDPVTGEKGIYPETLRGVNGYQPPEPPRPTTQPPPPPPKPEPWTPSHAEMAALIKLDDRGRAMRIVELVRQHPHLRDWFRDNPLPPVFHKREPPPPPQAEPEPPPLPPQWQASWETSWQVPPKPPVPPRREQQSLPTPAPETPLPLESIGRLATKVLWLSLKRLAQGVWALLVRSLWLWGVVAAAIMLIGVYLAAQTLLPRNIPPNLPKIGRPAGRHRAPPITHHGQRPAVPLPPLYSLPPLLPPGTGRPSLVNPQ